MSKDQDRRRQELGMTRAGAAKALREVADALSRELDNKGLRAAYERLLQEMGDAQREMAEVDAETGSPVSSMPRR